MKKFGFILISMALLCVSCETEIKDIEIKHLQPIKIEIGGASATTLEVNVTADSNDDMYHSIDGHGGSVTPEPSFDSVYLAVSTSPDMTSPTIYRAEAIKPKWDDKNTTISFFVTDLSSNVTYYMQAYVIPPYSKPIYSEIINHVQEKVEFKAIDLGLSVKWANMNVGANAPEEYGDYFAWGETSPKTDYSWSTYKYMQSGKSSWEYITKYTIPDGQKSGIWYNGNTFVGDNKTTLDPEDDAAHVNCGGSWRMPTKAEQDELINKCTWTWTSNYKGTGVKGCIVQSKKNSSRIFLPASGYRINSSLNNVGSYGRYWSSSLYVYSYNVSYLDLSSSRRDWWDCDRYYGHSVRPVCP